eukprot:2837326-Amphidinium_carterae.3
MAIPTSRKGPTRRQLTKLKKFVTVRDGERLAVEAARKLTIPWRQSSSHTHQGQGSVERSHPTLFAQVRAIRRFNTLWHGGQVQSTITCERSEALLPWILQHACFTINRHLVHNDGMTNYQRRWSNLQLGEVVVADIKPITVNKLDIRNKEQKTEGIWLGKTTNSGEHIIATMDEARKAFYTRSLTRLTPELLWHRKVLTRSSFHNWTPQ